ncbi:MAG TPA: hypothetical protein VG323_22775, partial [Thermoanaerobaculia bacterium]|nr:hypothetical protein [Thermoanaerobaculia bacterium]
MAKLNRPLFREMSHRERASSGRGGVELTRREMIVISGTAVVALPRVHDARDVPADFTTAGDARRLAFLVGGTERWVIDPSWFAGRPRLTVRQRAGGGAAVALRGARFAGTEIPADFVCEVRRHARGWRMRLRFAAFPKTMSASFVSWLAGAADLSCRTAVRQSVFDARVGSLSLEGGEALVTFTPDWVVRVDGRDVVRLQRRGGLFSGDAFTLAAAPDSAASLIDPPPPRRCRIAIRRTDGEAWPFPLDHLAEGHPWSFTAPMPVETIAFEAGEDGAGERAHALLARSADGMAATEFRPGGRLLSASGAPAAMALRSARYVSVSSAGGEEVALDADFDNRPATIRGDGVAASVSGGDGAVFELFAPSGGGAGSGSVAPKLCDLVVPSSDPELSATVRTFT